MRRTFRTLDWIVYAWLSIAQLGVAAWVFRGWVDVGRHGQYPVVFALLTILLLMLVVFLAFPWVVLPRMKDPVHMPPEQGLRVAMVTTFVPGAESLQMLARTVREMVKVSYPHETWVLDEGDDPVVKNLCRRLGAQHWSRRGKPQYHTGRKTRYQTRSKDGNYNSFFDEIGYERFDVIVGLDTDHVPAPYYLDRVLGYFRDPSIGYVQGAQLYYNQGASFIARGAAEETYSYYSCTLRAGNSSGHPTIVGCHHSHRVEALKQAGGFAPHDADDMLLTFHYCRSGWKGVYVAEPLAEGLTPTDWAGYLTQQRRWARSVLDLKFRGLRGLRQYLSMAQRLYTYVQGISYLQGLVTLLGIVVLSCILFTGKIPAFGEVSFFMRFLILTVTAWVASFFYQRFSICRRERGIHWRAAILQFAKWPVLLLALGEALLNKQADYALTPKDGRLKQTRTQIAETLPAFWPHYVTSALVLGGISLSRSQPEQVYLGVQAWAAVMIIASLLVIATSFMQPTPDYNPFLKPHMLWKGRVRCNCKVQWRSLLFASPAELPRVPVSRLDLAKGATVPFEDSL